MVADIRAIFREHLISKLHKKGVAISYIEVERMVEDIIKDITNINLIHGDQVIIGNYCGKLEYIGLETAYKS